jgi:hypothetical protein
LIKAVTNYTDEISDLLLVEVHCEVMKSFKGLENAEKLTPV